MTRICFLLGIMPRSGTNYLENVITLHDHCVHCKPICEDFLVSESDLLVKYAKRVNRHWNPDWDKDQKYVTTDNLLKSIGNGLLQFLVSPKVDSESLSGDKVLVSKTPSVKNIKNFLRLFPDTRLIILIRDGRAVVESGCKSFNWDFEKACYDWNSSAKNITNFLSEHQDINQKIKLVRYEELLSNTEETVSDIFHFLEVDNTSVSLDDVNNLHVSGSSEQRESSKAVNWKPVKKSDGFDPLKRYSHWSKYKTRRFEWLAGKSLVSLGYADAVPGFNIAEKVMHSMLDITWPLRMLPNTIRYAVMHKSLIIKTY